MHKRNRERSPSDARRQNINRVKASNTFNDNVEYKGQIYTRHNYFEDQRRKIDFVLVTNMLKLQEELDKLVNYLVGLMLQGIQYEISPGQEEKELVFIKLHCPTPVLVHNANIHNILFDCQQPRMMPTIQHSWFHCKIFNNITTQPLESNRHYLRAISSLSGSKSKDITSWERSLIMERILMKTKFGLSPKEKGINKLKAAGILLDAYPTHDGPWEWRDHGPLTDRQLLSKYWANLKCILKNQPIKLIYKYYGPEVAFYFAFVDYYTKMLTIPAFIGILCFIYNAATCRYIDAIRITEVCSSPELMCPTCNNPSECDFIKLADYCYAAKYNALFDNFVGIGYAVFTSMWGTIFLGTWQRREFIFKFHWNLLNCEIDTSQRVEFAHKAKHTRISPASGERENFMPGYIQFFKYSWTVLCCTIMAVLVAVMLLLVIFSRFTIRKLITKSEFDRIKRYQQLVTMTITAFESIIFIQLITPQFRNMAEYLTNEENPTTTLNYYNSCTYKFYFLSFINNYTPIFYIAFIKGAFYTHPADKKNYEAFGIRTDVCTGVGCSFVLTLYLFYFMGYKTFILRSCRVIKLLLGKIFAEKESERIVKEKRRKRLPAWERDYMLQETGELFLMTDFMDLAIQYGFVLFFIAGLPLTPLMALLANIVQIRLDAQRILRNYRRPVAKQLPGIGAWNSILRLVTFVGAMTNAFVISFSSDLLELEFYRQSYKTLRGFINSTLSEFATKDYPEQFKLLNKSIPVCVYRARRYPYYHEKKYEYSEEHYHVFVSKLCFVLIFQQMIWLLIAICSTSISAASDEVLEELNDEALKVRDVRYANAMKQFYGHDVAAASFQID